MMIVDTDMQAIGLTLQSKTIINKTDAGATSEYLATNLHILSTL